MCLRHLLPFDWRFSLHVRHTETSSLVARFALLRVRFPFPVLWCCKERASAEWQFALRRPRTRGVRGNKKSAELPFPRASSLKRCRKCATPKTGHEHVIFGRGVGTQQPQASVSFRDARTCSPTQSSCRFSCRTSAEAAFLWCVTSLLPHRIFLPSALAAISPQAMEHSDPARQHAGIPAPQPFRQPTPADTLATLRVAGTPCR